MSTNSADPTQLVGFSQSLDGVRAAATPFIEQASWAMLRYRTDCTELPSDSAAITQAADALDRVRSLTDRTLEVAAAFEVADRGQGVGVRTIDNATYVRALSAVIFRQGTLSGLTDDAALPTTVGISTDVGLMLEGDRDLTIGADGITGSLSGSILYGYRGGLSFDRAFGPIASHHEVEVTVGAEASGEVSATLGLDGADVHAEADVFVGGKMTGTSSWTLGPCTAEVEGTATAGAGAGGELDAHLGADGFTLDAGMMATLGVGVGAGASLSCAPPSWDDTKDWFVDRGEDAGDLLSDAGGAIVDVGSGLASAAGDRIEGVRGWLGW